MPLIHKGSHVQPTQPHNKVPPSQRVGGEKEKRIQKRTAEEVNMLTRTQCWLFITATAFLMVLSASLAIALVAREKQFQARVDAVKDEDLKELIDVIEARSRALNALSREIQSRRQCLEKLQDKVDGTKGEIQ